MVLCAERACFGLKKSLLFKVKNCIGIGITVPTNVIWEGGAGWGVGVKSLPLWLQCIVTAPMTDHCACKLNFKL